MNTQILTEKEFFSKDHTNVLKGIGIIVVFFNHILPYLKNNGYVFSPLTEKAILGNNILTQLMVGIFLFVSGYGVFESIKSKGEGYVKSIPQKRLYTTLFNFDVAVILFLILNICLGISLNANQIALSFIAWDAIGNSNWYIFAILCCYLFSYVSCRLFDDHKKIIVFLIVLTLLYCAVISQVKEEWWYNTVLCYPAGAIYSCYKEHFNKLVKMHFTKCILCAMVIFLVTLATLRTPFLQNVFSISFAYLILILGSKFNLNVKWLKWGGQKLFPLYIYQRLPMLMIATLWPQFIVAQPLLYIVISAIITIVLALIVPQFKINNGRITS